ncbi:MAG: hypothetical protein AAF907_10470, partial [Planctomycetota bacterium]
QILPLAFTGRGRRILSGKWRRLRSWEFWPPWLAYLPVIPQIARLGFRYGGLSKVTATNPAMPAGGFVVDVTATFQAKVDAIRSYRTQFPPEKERVFRLLEGLNTYFGAAAGFEYGEMFLPTTVLGATDLVRTVLPVEPTGV